MTERIIRKHIPLKLNLTDRELHALCKHFHFQEEDYEKIRHLYEAALPILSPYFTVERNPGYPFLKEAECAVIAVTLGKGLDDLIRVYEAAQCLGEAYMLDCMGMELLRKSYAMIEIYLQEEYSCWVSKMEFIGDTYPLEALKEILLHMEDGIACNEACMITPMKSAVYILSVSKEKPQKQENICGNICMNCNNSACQNRMKTKKDYTYGYQKIFGKKDI